MPEVRLVDADGTQVGVVPTREAQRLATERGLDLVEVAPTARPPVCRVMDYGKYKYELGRKERHAKKHQTQTRVKEVKFHANVGEHDYQTKLRKTQQFLEEGHRVKCSLYFRGRENDHREFGYEVMNRLKEDCASIGDADSPPRMMGRNLVMLLQPARNRLQAKKQEKVAED